MESEFISPYLHIWIKDDPNLNCEHCFGSLSRKNRRYLLGQDDGTALILCEPCTEIVARKLTLIVGLVKTMPDGYTYPNNPKASHDRLA